MLFLILDTRICIIPRGFKGETHDGRVSPFPNVALALVLGIGMGRVGPTEGGGNNGLRKNGNGYESKMLLLDIDRFVKFCSLESFPHAVAF